MGILKNVMLKVASSKRLMIEPKKIVGNHSLWGYYHIVSDVAVPHTDAIIPRVTIQRFRSDLDILLKRFAPLDFGAFLEGKAPEKPSIVITFDDGYREMAEIVAPILLEKGVQAIFFVNKAFVGNEALLHRHKASIIIHYLRSSKSQAKQIEAFIKASGVNVEGVGAAISRLLGFRGDNAEFGLWATILEIDFHAYLKGNKPFMDQAQLESLSKKGFWIGGHSVSHPDYSTLTVDQQLEETTSSMDFVQEMLGLKYRVFAFPYSDRPASGEFFRRIFALPQGIRPDYLFGNSGIKQDVHPKMIQRFSLEKPGQNPMKTINSELLHGLVLGRKINRK